MTDPDPWWLYHVGHPTDPADNAQRQAAGLPAYTPTDPKPTDQRPYLDYNHKRSQPGE